MTQLINKKNVTAELRKQMKLRHPKSKAKKVSTQTINEADSAMRLWTTIHVERLPGKAKEI